MSFWNLVDTYLDAAAKKLGDGAIGTVWLSRGTGKQCRACSASGASLSTGAG